jgi:hypothetical protein
MHPQPARQISQRQLEANRANAQRSTGPRTPEGKARSATNAFRHGLTGQISVKTDEDRVAFEKFTQSIISDLQPEGAIETQVALSIAEGHWRLNRIRSVEDNIFALGHYSPAGDIEVDNPELQAALISARVFLDSAKDFERLTLYEQRIQRGIERHMRELEALQQKRAAAGAEALAEAASLLQLAELNDEEVENGSEFSIEEIRRAINRKEGLKRAAYHEKHHWNPKIEYPSAA